VAESAREFFERLGSRVDGEQTRGINATYRFEVDPAGTWTVAVADDTGVQVTEDGNTEPDTTIVLSDETFERLVAGDLSPTAAFMTGKVKISGDMGAALKLQKLFTARG
jgi:putative sterol carrier protein